MSDNEQHDLSDDQPDVNKPGTNEPDASKQDALDDLLSARDAGVIALFDILRSEGKSVDQAVSKLVGDGVLPSCRRPNALPSNTRTAPSVKRARPSRARRVTARPMASWEAMGPLPSPRRKPSG